MSDSVSVTQPVVNEPDRVVSTTGNGRSSGTPPRRRLNIDVTDILDRYGILGAWLAIIILFAILEPNTFFTVANFETVFGSQAVLLILSLALLIPLTVGEFDLSVTGSMSVAAVLIGFLNVQHNWPIVPTVLVAIAAGVVIGLINTFFVMVVGVQSIVVTLGSGTLWMGVAYGIEPSNVAGISPGLVNVTATNIVGLPLAFWYGLILTLIAWYVYSYTPLGRYLHFVGANRQVSRMSGIPVTSIRAGSLMVSATVSAISGVVLVGTLASSSPSDSNAYLLPAFAAVFLGATAITPGRFNPWGTFIAVFFLITGITGLELFGLAGWVENVFYGASLVLAVALSRLAARRRGTE
jgi:ribose transport system permease protein